MPVTSVRLSTSFLKGRNLAAAGIVAIAAAAAVATLPNDDLAKAVNDGMSQGVSGIKTVAAMLSGRSPGQRPKGSLATLKHKKRAVLADRGTPERPNVIPPVAELLGTPATPIGLPPLLPPPVFGVLAGGPPVPVSWPTGGALVGPSGPPILGGIPLPGGGGGGITPPIVTAATPTVPVTAALPEPDSWIMMLLGFSLIGGVFRWNSRQRHSSVNA